ncbi:uncharacterized protein LOC62_03G003604 [Vanrija pseudolonga]|uniref:Mid2 domain-containing protein n=1 Tax=Vanrija pseudolonga TaxID=143232 RepID=A0AAF0YAM4_9TREE|nr:hypothetical protein LOC62_03G003604 [Vanrija pseudolonga]
MIALVVAALVCLLGHSVRAQGLFLSPISNATAGAALTIGWSGGVPPYAVAVLAFDSADLALLDTTDVASGLNATTYDWTVVASGAALQVRLSDAAGGVVSSAVFPVVNATLSTSSSASSGIPTAVSESTSTAQTSAVNNTVPPPLFSTKPDTESHGGMSQRTVNQIIGGVLGGVVLLAILVALIIFHYRHRRPGHPPAMLHDPGEKSPEPGYVKKRRGSEMSNGSSFFSGVEDSPAIRPSVRAASISHPLPLRTGSRAETNSYISQMTHDDGASGSERGPSRNGSDQRPSVTGRENSLDGPRVSIDSFYSNPDGVAAGSLRSVSASISARARPGGSAFNSTSMLGIGIAK